MPIDGGLRRGELLSLAMDSIQVREEHWVIADLKGKAGHFPFNQQVRHRVGRRHDAKGAVGGREGSGQPRGHRETRAA